MGSKATWDPVGNLSSSLWSAEGYTANLLMMHPESRQVRDSIDH